MKDLSKAKIIFRREITRNLLADILKIDQKGYIQDVFKFKAMISCYSTILLVKACFTLFLDLLGDFEKANIIAYQ